jgi:hypothetical protein
MIGENSNETKGISRKIEQNNGNSKISEWLKPEHKVEQEPEISQEGSNKKYYIIAGMIVFCCIAWYYSDDIKPAGISLMEWIRSFRPGPADDTNNLGDNLWQNIPMNFKSRLKRLFRLETEEERIDRLIAEEPRWSSLSSKAKVEKADLKLYKQDNSSEVTIKPLELIDQTATSSQVKIEDFQKVHIQHTGLTEINNDNFEESSSSVLREMDKFFTTTESSAFPELILQQGMYRLLRERLFKLSESNDEKYNVLTDNPVVNRKIERFIELEKDIFKDTPYNDVVQETAIEQDHWSDRGNSPSPTIQSPVQDSISQVLSPDMTTYAMDDYNKEAIPEPLIANKDYQDYVMRSHKTSKLAIEEENIEHNIDKGEPNIVNNIDKGKQKEQLPQIEIDSASDESMDHYFKERAVTQEEVKSGFSSLFDSIKNKKKTSVTSSPEIAQVGLQPSINPTQETVSEQPISLLEQIKRGKSLKHVETKVQDEEIDTTSKTFIGTLSSGFDKFMVKFSDLDDEGDITENFWNDDTPTTSEIKTGKILKVVKKTQDQESSKIKSFLDDVKENSSDADLSEGKSKITKPFRYLLTQSEVDRRELEANKTSGTTPSKFSQLN